MHYPKAWEEIHLQYQTLLEMIDKNEKTKQKFKKEKKTKETFSSNDSIVLISFPTVFPFILFNIYNLQ